MHCTSLLTRPTSCHRPFFRSKELSIAQRVRRSFTTASTSARSYSEVTTIFWRKPQHQRPPSPFKRPHGSSHGPHTNQRSPPPWHSSGRSVSATPESVPSSIFNKPHATSSFRVR